MDVKVMGETRSTFQVDSPHAAVIAKVCRMIDQATEAPCLEELAEAAGLSPHHFHRVFKKLVGLTPKAYADGVRAEKLRLALTKRSTVTEAIYEAGFNSSGRFYEQSKQTLGMDAKRYRAGGKDEMIRFAIGQCSLGAVLAASSAKGVCCILLGDDPGQLLEQLQDRFPSAELVGGDPDYEQAMALIIGFVDAPRIGLSLPLDIRGTSFQRRVWQALRDIPAGVTMSYRDIAEKIGSPKSCRAVAGACAANPLAVAIPCHRVVRTDGELSGYRWGIQRKRALLDREGKDS